MSRVLAAFLTILFSAVGMLVTQVVNPGEVVLSGGLMVAAVLSLVAFPLSFAFDRWIGLRYPRTIAMAVVLLPCLLALHFGLIGWGVVLAFTLLQFALRRSNAFRLKRTAADRGKP